MPAARRCGIEPLHSQRGGDSNGAESEGRERRDGNDREQRRGGEIALHVPTLMQRRDVGETPSRETALPSAFAVVRPRCELKGWTMGRTQSWSKGWTQRGPSTSAHRQVRRAWPPPRADSGNSVKDLHAPGLTPPAKEVKSPYGASRNPRASPLIAAYFVDETFRFGCRATRVRPGPSPPSTS